MSLSSFERIYLLVLQIPKGKVATYKQLAQIEGSLTARQVGYAMANCPKTFQGRALPWHRVINSQGSVSPRKTGENHIEQKHKLISEGALELNKLTVNLEKVLWHGPSVEWLIENNFKLPY